jgi:hypothetical protein
MAPDAVEAVAKDTGMWAGAAIVDRVGAVGAS